MFNSSRSPVLRFTSTKVGIPKCVQPLTSENQIDNTNCENNEVMDLLGHIKSMTNSVTTVHGVGIDYNAELIKTAGIRSELEGLIVQWLIYDFNDDQDDLVNQLINIHQVTHVFIALVPKQLALQTVRQIIVRLCESGVVVCCYKYHPDYLRPARQDHLMGLVVYDTTS